VNLSLQQAIDDLQMTSRSFEGLQSVASSAGEAFVRLFGDVASGARSAADAVRDLGRAFASIVAQEAARGLIRALPGFRDIPSFQHGGLATGGLALVGERGPELVDFRRPGRVYDTDRTAGLLAGGARSIEVNVTGVRDAYDVRRVIFESLPEIAAAVRTLDDR